MINIIKWKNQIFSLFVINIKIQNEKKWWIIIDKKIGINK
jgi:hypothetical protein